MLVSWRVCLIDCFFGQVFLTNAKARARQMLDATRQNGGAGTQVWNASETPGEVVVMGAPQILYLCWWVQ